jgi:sodium-dependent dicarboxylate transporter 2/3/5
MANGREKKVREKNRVFLARDERQPIDWKRIIFILLGLFLFFVVYFSPDWGAAVDPAGKVFQLTREGKAAIGLFLLASVWWIFEVVPIGVTAIMIGVVQALFLIRDPQVVFTDFMDPSVWFIFASIVIGLAFAKTGLTKRMAYKMLSVVGEKTSMIYLGSFLMVALLTLIMAHTAVAAATFPLLMTIYSLYDPEGTVTKFGKGLFIGMAFVAGAGSIITLLGSARAAVALGFFKNMTGQEIGFFELSYYMLPVGLTIVFLIWIFLLIMFKPERSSIPGLSDKVKMLSDKLGSMNRNEALTLIIVFSAILLLSLRSFVPALESLNKSGILLITTVSFFVFKILDVKDLEDVPWNIILLFGGAMCIGFCLWKTGAADWMAVNWLKLFQNSSWFVFVIMTAFFVLIMTNFIMNVAAIAITLPVALATCQYLGVAPHVIIFASLVTAGMPFMLLIGAAPNAIAYESRQFTSGEFLKAGIPMSIILMVVLGIFIWLIWPLMGMPVLLAK